MKNLGIYTILVAAIAMLGFNAYFLVSDAAQTQAFITPKIAWIGVLGSLCAIVLLITLLICKKIRERLNERV